MTTPTQRLEALGLVLPDVPAPAAAYQPVAQVGELVLTAGQLPIVGGALQATGKVGDALDTDEAAALARLAALNVLAAAASAVGGLDVLRIVKATVFVASTPDFHEQHLVANGASALFGEVLGDHGVHARSAVGVSVLPLDSPVEVEAICTRVG
ncbi:MAG: RidA family protein [Nitriliruptoraceae bacterium]|nr:RidA family protein [Nitriliruptoraceae bacterium]